jgi:hypothetical protein
MRDLDQFIASLGPHANHYTAEELKELFDDVDRLSRVLIAIHNDEARTPAADRAQCVQGGLDSVEVDRTIERK